ncbi:MAG: helix-turn-helix domain-containing protein [Lachnospiraceae bacterium]|nr:helix-turn-helix domain-containing protein [Lachnospiraceae bacterium]MBP5651954.1 helix-turn-helix domain-containing protein [Lachnospiraceae bacterium]
MIEILNGIVETVSFNNVSSVRIYHNRETDDYPIHWHTAMEIIMPYDNTYQVIIGNDPITLGEKDILIIPPGELHQLKAPATGSRMIMMVDYSLLCNLKGMDSLLHNLHPYMIIRTQNNDEIRDELAEVLRNYMLQIESEYFGESPYFEARIYSLLISFFVDLGRESNSQERRFGNFTTNKQHEYVQKFMTVCNYINEHCTEDVTVDELADIAGFSKFHFARLFKQFTNVSYYDYLTRKRIEHAETLLITPDISITEVAMQSGFNSLSTFNRVFKNLKNCTPSEYKGLNHPYNQKVDAAAATTE